MARVEIKRVVIDAAGNVQVAAPVTIKHAGTANNATIYQAETGVSTLGQPLSTDSNGYIPGWIEEGSYDVTLQSTTIRMQFLSAARRLGALPVQAYPDSNPQSFAWDLRDHSEQGVGVAGHESFPVLQRQAGANMSVDIGATGVGLMQAWVRGSSRTGQGIYRVDNIDRSAPTASTYHSQLNVTVTAAHATLPRLDQVVLEILDPFHNPTETVYRAQVRVVAGTATGGATLDNRTGAAALPVSSILLADVLVAGAATTITTAAIRDRRPYALRGTVPNISFTSGPAGAIYSPMVPVISSTSGVLLSTTHDNHQAAALMYLARRVTATRIRWRYSQGATIATSNYVIAIFDASGRQIIASAATAFAGTLNSSTEVALTITSTTFEAGLYYVFFGVAAVTVSSSVKYNAVTVRSNDGTIGVIPPYRGVTGWAVSGGTTVPTTLSGLTDGGTGAGATTAVPVPVIALTDV